MTVFLENIADRNGGELHNDLLAGCRALPEVGWASTSAQFLCTSMSDKPSVISVPVTLTKQTLLVMQAKVLTVGSKFEAYCSIIWPRTTCADMKVQSDRHGRLPITLCLVLRDIYGEPTIMHQK